MFFILWLLTLLSFVLYFYFLWLWFFALIPLIFLLIGLAYVLFKTPLSLSSIDINRYGLIIARFLILASLFGISSFFAFPIVESLLWLLVLNSFLWIVSFVLPYEDWKKIFQFGYYLVLVALLVFWIFVFSGEIFLSFLLLLFAFQFGFLWFFTFIVGFWVTINKNFYYTVFVSWLLLFLLLILTKISSFPAALSLISIILSLIYLWIWWFVQRKPVHRGRISVRRILAGEKIITKTFFSHAFLDKINIFIHEMPQTFKYILETINILVVVLLFGYFIFHWTTIGWWNHLFYWVIISFFIGNVMLLKRLQYTSFLQNLFLFLVIHFAVYVSLFSYFEGNIQSVVFWSVFWNIITSVGLFLLPTTYQYLFTHKDYWYRIITSIISFLVNVFLLFKSWLAGELIFFLLLLYAGIESMLVFYGIKHINKKFVPLED